eukprot:COSAG02_NODE_60815_length_270_cov_0.608187_1_plen_61_part_10
MPTAPAGAQVAQHMIHDLWYHNWVNMLTDVVADDCSSGATPGLELRTGSHKVWPGGSDGLG